jgi:hypothetical protein
MPEGNVTKNGTAVNRDADGWAKQFSIIECALTRHSNSENAFI